ncbi:MAG: hypothetical protein SFX18_13225 [Pirellulales bacterium]|nr:hypothetical protein [Pirellulales bacterium]
MRRLRRIWAVCLTALAFAVCMPLQNAPAAFVSLTGDPVALSNLPNGQLIAGDKLFSMFALDGIAFGGSIPQSLSTFLVQGGQDSMTGEYGLRFLMSMNAGSGATTNANLTFKVSVIPDPMLPPSQQMVIGGAGVGMVMSGASATGNGIVNIAETIFANSSPNSPILGSLSVSKQQNSPLGDLEQTTALTTPSSSVFVRKAISVTGGASGSAHLGEFFQFYNQVIIPEVSSVLMGGIFLSTVGVLMLFGKLSRKHDLRKNVVLGCSLLAALFLFR